MKWYPVLVKWSDGDSIEDGIKGENPIDALNTAKWNWPDAELIKIQEDK